MSVVRIAFGILVSSTVLTTANAQRIESKVTIGDKVAEWKDLEGVDGKKHDLAEFKDAKVIVVAFTCNHCPVAAAYEDRLVKLQSAYKKKGVALVAINPTGMTGRATAESDLNSLEKMKQRAKKVGYNFPYLADPNQKVARSFAATATPHLFVLDEERKIAYSGAFDDNINAEDVKKQYVRDAVNALLAGKKPSLQRTKQVGCAIQYR